MPRIYDYQNEDPKAREVAYLAWDAFPRHADPVYGRGEIELSDLNCDIEWPSAWIRPSFSRTNADNAIYSNEANDCIHAWLSEHSTGRWHWREESVNHGHSVDIGVWIEEEVDREAFAVEWGDVFTRDLKQEQRNDETLAAGEGRSVSPIATI